MDRALDCQSGLNVFVIFQLSAKISPDLSAISKLCRFLMAPVFKNASLLRR